jgi:catechol 2,3-dioxygenase-like lactoylglutathione lyase family enzyme
MIEGLDFVGIPSRDAERSRAFYVDTLGLRPDEKGRFEFWVGETCFAIWEPGRFGMPFEPQRNAHPALHVGDVAVARSELEAKGVEFVGDILDTGVCHMAFFKDPEATT